jgi:hypothetical protein
MMAKASKCGLTFRREITLDGDEALGPITDSYKEFLKGAYSWVWDRSYRPIGATPAVREDGTHTNVNETIDASVFDRWRADNAYRPANLAEWAGRLAVDPARLRTSVSASDAAVAMPD